MENDNNYLFDVFYGKDYLRLVCGASRLRTSTQGVSFWVGEYVVRLRKDVGEKNLCPYTLSISVRKTQNSVFSTSLPSPDLVREVFCRCTGLTLDL